MHDSRQTNYNEIKSEIERFEMMEKGQKNFFFDVHIIEEIFDFYTDKFQYEKAEKVINIGIHQHPNATALQVKQAIVLMEKGEDERAMYLLQNLSHLESSNSEVYLNLGLVYLRNDYILEAEENFRKALEISSEDREYILLDIGIFFNQHEVYTKAIEFLKPACIEFKENENLIFELAYAYDKEYDLINGIETYEKVIVLNPFSENAWYNLGILHAKSDNLEMANECYDFALAIYPEHGEAIFNKANALVGLHKLEEALDYYFDYISMGYEPTLPYHYIADSLEQMNRTEDSLRYYRLVTNKFPQYMPAWLNYLATLVNKEMVEEALEASVEVLKYHSDYGEMWYLRGRVLLLNHNLTEALDAFEKAFEDDPDSLRNIYELYELKLALQPKLKREELLEEWHNLYPTSPAVHYMYCAHYLMEDRNITRAVTHLDFALEEDPNIELFLSLFPKAKSMIKKSKKLSRIIDKHFDYEF